jgi:hypothetical protein
MVDIGSSVAAAPIMPCCEIHSSTEQVDIAAERYVLGHMTLLETRSYEEHMIGCEVCQGAVEATAEFLQALLEILGVGEVVEVEGEAAHA